MCKLCGWNIVDFMLFYTFALYLGGGGLLGRGMGKDI